MLEAGAMQDRDRLVWHQKMYSDPCFGRIAAISSSEIRDDTISRYSESRSETLTAIYLYSVCGLTSASY